MRDLLVGTWYLFYPVLETTTIRSWVKFIDGHFMVLGSFAVLFISFALWVNI